MQGVLLTAPLDPKLRVADGERLGEQEPSCVLSCRLCWLLRWEQGSSPVCVRARVCMRARARMCC